MKRQTISDSPTRSAPAYSPSIGPQNLKALQRHRRILHDKQQAILRAASTFILSAFALNIFQRNSQPSPDDLLVPAMRVTAPQPTLEHTALKVMPFAERVASERVERVPVALPPEKIGVLIDVNAEDLTKHRLQFTEKNGTISIDALPQVASNVFREVEYETSSLDPISRLPDSMNPNQIRKYLDLCKENIRARDTIHFVDNPVESATALEFSAGTMHVWDTLEDNSQKSIVHLTATPNKDSVYLRIKLDRITYDWFKQIFDMPEGILGDLEQHLNKHQALVNFLSECLVIENHTISNAAKETIELLYGLSQQDRLAFAEAILSDNLAGARAILVSTQPYISQSLFNSLNNYVQMAKRVGIKESDIKEGLKNGITDFGYDELAEFREKREGYGSYQSALPILRDSVSEQQFKAMESIPYHLLAGVMTYLLSKDEIHSYDDFLISFRESQENSTLYFRDPSSEQNPKLIPQHMILPLKRNLHLLTGSNPTVGWLDYAERDNNILSIIGLIEIREKLRRMLHSLKDTKATAFKGIYFSKDGDPSMILQLPLGDPVDVERNNRNLLILSNLMYAASVHQQLPGNKMFNEAGAVISAARRSLEFFANDNRRLEDIEYLLIPPYQVIDYISSFRPPSQEILDTIHPNTDRLSLVKTSQASPTVNINVRDIMCGHKQESHAASVEEGVTLPTGTYIRR